MLRGAVASAGSGCQRSVARCRPTSAAQLLRQSSWPVPALRTSSASFRQCRLFSSEEPKDADDEPSHKAVVLSKRLPQDFIENTLMPHLESQLLDSIHVYTPAELAQIARCYSKQEIRQRALSQKLSDTIKFRISGFEAVDIVDALGPMHLLTPGDDELWEVLEGRIIVKLDDFTALNFMGIIRIYNKRANKHNDLLLKVVPRLRELLSSYEGVELSEMLLSMAQSKEAATDMDILMTLVPEIERRYGEVSLVHSINNVWGLTQLKMVHEGMLKKVAADLTNTTKTKDLTPGYMARIAWVYRRCNAWDMVRESMLPLIRAAASEFRAGDFARLAQSLPEEKQLLGRIADLLHLGILEMGRKDFMLFFLGCVHGEVLEARPDGGQEPGPITAACLSYIREEQDNFKRDEVQKIVYLLHFSPKFNFLVDELPVSWNATKVETMDHIAAKGSGRS
mmetsp:Transcript_68716/g.123850  ORF Transcript_68716/g.123850 Transcript_68716/m.123850 type:complete len:452 (-) Transcript_68716:80-1435(-)